MVKIIFFPGEHVRDACERAIILATKENKNVKFKFNQETLIAKPNMNPVELHGEFNKRLDLGPPKTREEERVNLLKKMKETEKKTAKAIKKAKVSTEKQMREEKVPTPNSLSELSTYIKKLVDRPHDYGTCTYAMSMSAVAAFNFAASQLGVTGFQASCADLDILRRTRGFEWGRILKYEDLLYPQHCNDDHFPSSEHLLNDPEIISELAKRAKTLLNDHNNDITSKNVIEHWRSIIARDIYINFGGKDAKKA